ncbi:MAG: response regulator [Oscillospiraceae bacterium]|nr:response regulator [Oscillospiraceae bacterium]
MSGAEFGKEVNQTEKDDRKKIICVDDVQFMLLSLKDRLKDYYKVYPAQSDEILFEILEKTEDIDLILLDINMPNVDGYEIIRRLKGDKRYAAIPIMFLTGNRDKESVVQAFELGAVDVLFKPITKEELLERIDYQFNPESYGDKQPIILAVDDSPSILKALNETLNDMYKVYTLTRPEAISEVLKRVTPDLFVLDCNMPNMSGFELVKIIRNTPPNEDTPIVFLTSESNKDALYAAIGLGISEYILKPIDAALLREKIAAQLGDCLKRRMIRSVFK